MVLLGRKTIHSTKEEEKKKMRDTKTIEMYSKKLEKKLKELEIFKLLKKEVNHGANGTQDYVIKKGINKGKVAK
mgnify:CR=1 FL=1|jgi:hypothetical protein